MKEIVEKKELSENEVETVTGGVELNRALGTYVIRCAGCGKDGEYASSISKAQIKCEGMLCARVACKSCGQRDKWFITLE